MKSIELFGQKPKTVTQSRRRRGGKRSFCQQVTVFIREWARGFEHESHVAEPLPERSTLWISFLDDASCTYYGS